LFDGGQTDDGYIKAHILTWLANLHDNQGLATRDSSGARDGLIGALHRLHSDASAIRDYHGLSDVHACDLPGHAEPTSNVFPFVLIRRAPREHTGSGTNGLRNSVESTRRIPSSSSTRATAPISASVFFRGSENSSFASFQSAGWS